MNKVFIEFTWEEVAPMQRVLKPEIQRQLIKETGDEGMMLYQFYARRTNKDNYDYPDEDAAEFYGWPLSKVARTRRKLYKKHWMCKRAARYSNGESFLTVHLGKKMVLDILGIRELASWEYLAIGKRVKAELGEPDEMNKAELKEARKLYAKYVDVAEHSNNYPDEVIKDD